MKKLINYFLQGLLLVVPIAVTLYVVYIAIIWMDSLIPIQVSLPIPGWEEWNLPGLGILVILIIITILGYFGTRFVRNPLFMLIENLMERTPLLKVIYTSVKDLVEAFVGEKKRFTQPVLVKVNYHPEVQRIGFVTENDLSQLGLGAEKMAVYLPFSYGFNGQLVIVSTADVKAIDSSGTEMMKFVISGGVTEI